MESERVVSSSFLFKEVYSSQVRRALTPQDPRCTFIVAMSPSLHLFKSENAMVHAHKQKSIGLLMHLISISSVVHY